MYPLHETHLSLLDIAEEWAADLPQAPGVDRVRNKLIQAFWEGNLDVGTSINFQNNISARLRYLHACRSLIDGHPGIVFVDNYADIPSEKIHNINGSITFVNEKYVVWSASDDVNSERFTAACRILSTTCFEDYSDFIKVGLCAFVVQRETLAQLCRDSGWPLPGFWFAKGSAKSPTGMVVNCRRWLMAQVAAGPKRMPKAGYQAICLREFPGLSIKRFKAIWEKHVPLSWRRAGRPPKGRWKSNPDEN